MVKSKKSLICKAIFIFIFAFILYFLHFTLGFFYADDYSKMENCISLETPYGPEDLQTIGKYVVSGHSDRIQWIKNPAGRLDPKNNGGIILIDPENAKIIKPEILGLEKNKIFNPQGIHVLNNKTLYVINQDHSLKRDFIEAFDILEIDGKLAFNHTQTIYFFNPTYYTLIDDIHFISDSEFYATTWLLEPGFPKTDLISDLKQSLASLILKPTSLLYCEVKFNMATCYLQDSGHMMNGVVSDGKYIYAVDTIGQTVNVYNIRAKDNLLTKIQTINLGMAADNIIYDEKTKKFYLGAFRLKEHVLAGNTLKKGEIPLIPGGVIELNKTGNNEWNVNLLFMQEKLSGISTALPWYGKKSKKLILGTFLDNKIYICEMK